MSNTEKKLKDGKGSDASTCSAAEEYAKNGHTIYEAIKNFIKDYSCGDDDQIYNIKWGTGEMMDVFCEIIEKYRPEIESHYMMRDKGIKPRDIIAK